MKTQRILLAADFTPSPVDISFSFYRMKSGMFRIGCNKFKIFFFVIINNAINMMHNFFSGQVSPNMFLHNEAMLKDISPNIRKLMFLIHNLNISRRKPPFSTFPIIMIFPRKIRTLFPFMPRDKSFFKSCWWCRATLFPCGWRANSFFKSCFWYKMFPYPIGKVTLFRTKFSSFVGSFIRFCTFKAIIYHILIISLIAGFSNIVFAQETTFPPLEITEEDASPSCFGYKIKFANSNVTDNGDGTCSIADQTGAGGGDPILIDTTAVGDAAGVDLTGGTTGIDITFSAAASPDTATFGLDATELEALTWGAGGNASNIWTFNLLGTDPAITFSSGAMDVTGTFSATQLTSSTILTDLIDGVGAVDIDLGSVDITDFTVVTDGGTVILDGNVMASGVALKPTATVVVCSSTARGGNLCDYIADGTDDNVQIQAAIDLMTTDGVSKGGRIFLTEGTFNISDSLSVDMGGVELIGSGIVSTVIKAKNSLNKDMIVLNVNVADQFFALKDLTVNGNDSNNTSGRCFYDSQGSAEIWDVHIDHVFFTGCTDEAIELNYAWGALISNTIIEFGSSHGIKINTNADAKIERCKIIDNDGIPIWLVGAGNSHITDNYLISGTGQPAIYIQGNNNTIRGNTIYDSSSYANQIGIKIDGNGNVVSFNMILMDGDLSPGIELVDSTVQRNIIAFNLISSTGTETRILDNGDDNTIIDIIGDFGEGDLRFNLKSGNDLILSSGDLTVKDTIQSRFEGLIKTELEGTGGMPNGADSVSRYIDNSAVGEWSCTDADIVCATDTTSKDNDFNTLSLVMSVNAEAGDKATNTLSGGNENWSGNESIGVWMRTSIDISLGDFSFRITDSGVGDTNFNLCASTADNWIWCEVDISGIPDASKDDITDISITYTVDKGAMTAYFGYLVKWDLSDEILLNRSVLIDGIRSIEINPISSASNMAWTRLVEYTDFFVNYQSGSDAIIPLADRSSSAAIILYNYED